MSKVIDIADFWQFKISFEKYGLLCFERIHDSELFSWNKEIKEDDDNFFSKLFKKTFDVEMNVISLSEINFHYISENEQKLFYEKYFEKQFYDFKIKKDKSIVNNFKIACSEFEKMINADKKKLYKSLKEQQARYNKHLDPTFLTLKHLEKISEPIKVQQEMLSKVISAPRLNSIQLAMESMQRKNNLLSSLMLPKSVNPFIGIQDSVKLSTFSNIIPDSILKSLDNLSSNIESFNLLRNSLPKSLFDYEEGFARKYSDIYSSLSPNWNLIYSEIDDSEPYLANKEGQFIPFANAKDVVGATELFLDITDFEIAKFLGVLEKYPFFASQDSTGIKIYEGLKEYIKTKTINIEGEIFYRARKWEKGQHIPFTENTMWTAPYGKPSQGRFNFLGIPYLYLAETIEIAKKETSIRNGKKKEHTVMKVTNHSEFILFDMTSLNSYIFQYCNYKNPNKNYTQYLLPNYIAQCLDYMNKYENIKIDGIKYTSVHNKKGENYANYVLFNKTQYDFKNIEIVE